MNRSIKQLIYIILCITITLLIPSVDFQSKATDATPLRVVCIGDSITEAGDLVNGEIILSYRYALWKKFVDAGVEVEFLGRITINPGLTYKGKQYPSAHLGWGGKRIEDVDGYLKDGQWGNASDGFDIALVLIGYNNIMAWDGKPQPTVSEFNQLMKNLISTIREKQANAKILLQTPPLGGSSITLPEEYAKEYEKIARQTSTKKSPVYYLSSPPNYVTEYDTYDNVHPNEVGEQKLANHIWKVMQYLVGVEKLHININKVTDRSKYIKGRASKDGVVTVKVGKKKFVKKASQGKWKIKVKKANRKAGTKIWAYVEINGVRSQKKSVFVLPSVSKVNKIKAGSKFVKGVASKGVKIYVSKGRRTFIGRANKKGSFAVQVPKLRKGTKLTIYCKVNKHMSKVLVRKVK